MIAGYRGQGRSVHIYYADDDAAGRATMLDNGGMAAAACAAADLNGDGGSTWSASGRRPRT